MAELHRMNLYVILVFGMDGLRDGHIVEFGSFMGGNATKVAKTLHPGMQVFAFDTFEGMPDTDRHRDLHSSGDFRDADYAGLVRGRLWFWRGRVQRSRPSCFCARKAQGCLRRHSEHAGYHRWRPRPDRLPGACEGELERWLFQREWR